MKNNRKVVLAGNPNVGKSTVFNEITGSNQHTGNWTGKTVDLAKGNYYYKYNDYELVDLPGSYSLVASSKEEEVTRDYIESLNQSHLGTTRLIANLVPKKNDRIIPFENMVINLVDTSYGDPKLGILKMDVDNLGAIFAFGMEKQRSLSKFLTLSRMMENFFGHELMNICVEVSKKMNSNISQFSDNESMFYINYAGGDDLVIMGPASGILELSKVINERFSEYTLNKNITISGGITIQSPSAPIRFGIKEAEEYLNQSKILDGKNGITLIHTSCKMNEYEQVLQQVNVFRKYITNQDISRTNFYNMMKVLDVENMEKYYRNIPILLYSLKRNVKNKDVRQDLISKISMANMNYDQLKKLVLEMKLAIMQTRG